MQHFDACDVESGTDLTTLTAVIVAISGFVGSVRGVFCIFWVSFCFCGKLIGNAWSTNCRLTGFMDVLSKCSEQTISFDLRL